MAIGVWYRVNGVVNGQSSYYEGGFEWRIVSQSKASNSSIVEFRQFARKTSSLGGMYNLYTNTSYYDIDGVRYNFASRVDMREAVANVYNYMEADGSTAVFPRCATKTVQITHLEDGTRSVPVTTYLYGGVPEGFDNITTTATITLDALNPAESVSSDEFLKVYRLIGSTKTYVGNLAYPIDVKIEKELEYDKQTLTFKVEDIHDVKEEDYLRFYGAEWIVKEIVRNGQVFDIIAKHNIEKLEHTAIAAFKKTSKNLKTVLDDLFAFLSIPEYGIEGWTYEFGPTLDISNPSSPYYADALVVRTYTRNVDLKRVMGYEVIQEIASIWFLEVEFDTLNKKAIFHIQRGEDKGVYFSSQLNLKQINQRSDTNELITRLIPIGKDDLTIASVNGGSIALNNNTYSDKVLTAYWIDTNYTTAQSLKDDGTKRLAELAKPLVSYSCDIIDLRQVYPMLSYDLGDGVTIIDTTLNIRTSQRIVQMTVYPFHPEDNTVEMANRLLKFTDIQKDVIRSSEALRQITLPDGSVAGNNVVASDGTTHNDTTKTLVTVITDESQVSQSMTAVIFTNENQTIGATASNLVVEETVIYTSIDVLSGGVLANATIGTVEFYDTDNTLISISPVVNKVNPTNVSSGSLEIVLAPATDMTDRAGYVRVQITVNGIDYYKKIGWNLVSGTLGEDGLSAVLSNEAMTVTTLPDGSGGVYTDVQTQMKVFVGIIDDTSNWSFSATTSAGVTGAFDGVIPNLYKVTNLTTDNGYVDITATQTDYPSITKRFTISKSKNGTPGVNGLPAVSATLSADSVTLPADKDGVVASFATATTTMSVFIGDTNDSTNWTYATSVTNCTITGTNTRTVTLTAMSADVAYVDITASKSGFPNITKRFTIAKARAGQTGAPGANAQYVVVNGQQAFVFPENGLNATNLVTNGDFSNGTTGWLGSGTSSLTAIAGGIKIVGNGSQNYFEAYTNPAAVVVNNNDKVYIYGKLKSIESASSVMVRAYNSNESSAYFASPTANTVYTLSGVFSYPTAGTYTLAARATYADAASASGKQLEVYRVMAINLTAIFGVGNEPTAGQMDALLSKYDTKWFDGTGSLYAVPSPAAITLTANLFGGLTVYDWEYWNGTAWANLSGTQNTQTYSVSYGATEFNGSDTLRVRCLSGTAYDEITLVRLYDGVSGQDGTDGTNGANGVSAITVLLSNEAHTLPKTAGGVITYTGSGTTIRLYEGTTELTYDGVGTSNGTWKVVATPTNITTGTLTDSGAYVTVGDHSAMTANNATISYLITGKRADGTAISITKVQSLATALQGTAGQDGTDGADGVSALSAVLSREAVSVPTDSAGNNAVYTNTTTEIRVYEGATELTYDGVGTANGTWKVIAAGTNITAGAITDSGTYATTQVASAMTADTASIAFTISGKRADGTAFSFVKTQTFAKAKQGATGSAGTPAQYVVVNGEQAFKFLTGSATPTVTSITLTADLFGGLTTYDWEYWNGTAWANLSGTQNAQTYALAYNNAAWGTATSLRIRCLSGTYYDEVTIVKLYDGANGTNGTNGVNAVSGYLTNETVSVPTAADGTGYVLTSAGGTFKVYNGTTDVTTSATFSGGATKNGLTLSIVSNTGVYSLSGASWTTDTESFSLTGTYNGTTITKVYTITKAKAGTNGANGADGADGADGAPATSYWMSLSTEVVNVDQYGNYNIDSVIIEAFSQSGANPVSRYAARFRIEELINDVWQTPVETSTDEDSYEHFITAGTTQIKISTYQAGGFTVMLGSKTVVMVFDGADGEGGKYVSIAPTTNVFISTDSGSTYTPSAIKLTPQLSNAVFTKWQYSFDGEAFTDFPSAEPAKGSILSGNVLSIPNTSTLYTPSMAVTFKLVAAAGAFNVYDVITITRIIDSSTTLADYVAETTTRVEDLEGFKVTVETDLYPNGIENPSEIDLLTTWQQSIDNFLLGIQSGGGYNLIKNSVGYRDPNTPTYGWVKTGAGTVYQIGASTSAFISKSESKNGIGILGTATLTQTITVAPNRAMSFAGVVNKASTGQTLQIYLTNGTNTYYLVNTTGALDGARQYVFIPASASTNWQLVIAGTNITGVLEITDLVLSYGENVTQWQQAVGEIHNLNVLIDINGMTIKALDGTTEVGYTNITPYEFAGYYQGNKIFTLNGSVTEVQELKIKKTVGATETALTMAPVRVVQAPAGLYWVWVGDIE